MAADGGHVYSMYFYGYMVINGIGVQKDVEEALKYLQIFEGIKYYARILERGYDVKQNLEEALKYYKMAVSKGDIDSIYGCTSVLEKCKDYPNHKKEIAKYYKIGADNGNTCNVLLC